MVLRACELEKDIEILPQGDEAIIGERGVNLSGGQKAHLCIRGGIVRSGPARCASTKWSERRGVKRTCWPSSRARLPSPAQ